MRRRDGVRARAGRLLAAAALLLPACGSAPKSEAEPGYRAFCATESRFLGPWRPDRAAAEADRQAHLHSYGWHAVRINTR